MYVPPAFRNDDSAFLAQVIRDARLCNFVTATAEGPMSTPLPLYYAADEGEHGTLYGHLARANPQWKAPVIGDGLAIFSGAHAYVTPSWYASKNEDHKVVPTWNYLAVHAYGPVEFIDDADRLLELVTRLTDVYEQQRAEPWRVSDAPERYIATQLRGIVGLRMPITRIFGKAKMSQNRNAADRAGVAAGLAASDRPEDREVARLIPVDE